MIVACVERIVGWIVPKFIHLVAIVALLVEVKVVVFSSEAHYTTCYLCGYLLLPLLRYCL